MGRAAPRFTAQVSHGGFISPAFFVADGGNAAPGTDSQTPAVPSVSELRRPVTAQERQREREEKRRKRQERARERERKMKEKERREGRQGDSLGGVLLSDDDKSLLQRWTKMVDRRRGKTSTCEGAETKDPHRDSRESASQHKTPADVVEAESGGMDVTAVAGGFKNNTLKAPGDSEGQGGLDGLTWRGQGLEPHKPADRTPQTTPDPRPHILPLESFLTKAPALTNGTNLNPHQNPPATSSGPMEKLCPSAGEKSGSHVTNPLCGPLGAPSQPHLGLGFTDTGQQGPPAAPDIHTVTLQLSRSQVGVSAEPCALHGPVSPPFLPSGGGRAAPRVLGHP